jgi:cyclopropane fatty-acyl-phospholipid synthase-like methyltransferase
MPNPLLSLVEKYAGPNALPRARQFVFGLAEDFWKDGPENPFVHAPAPASAAKSATTAAASHAPATTAKTDASPAAVKELPPWHAAPGEISEKMWGAGYVQPGDEALSQMLITPLGLNKDLSVLDLSAGLGGRLRKTAEDFGVYVTGLEPDPAIAARGMEMSIIQGKGKRAAIAAYDPANFSVTRQYDCIIARETFYRVADRRKFFTALGTAAKPKAQVSFTDYIVNPEDREKPAVKAWMAYEKGANPTSLIEMAEDWAKAGFSLRVHDDQTTFYVKEVKEGVKRLATFLASGHRPDDETKQTLRRRIETWAHRLVALEQGMKFYRFYGTKQ